MKQKSFLRKLLSAVIVLAILAVAFILIIRPLYGKKDDVTENPPVVNRFEGKGETLVMENDALLFSLNTADTTFSVTEKESGRVWYSNPTDLASDKIALTNNKEILSSTLILSYTTTSGPTDMNNYAYSIKDQTYAVCQEEDGSIRVDYSVGKLGRIYIIPEVIAKPDYAEITGKMSSANKSKVSSYYTLVEPSKLQSKSNKDELIAMYPSITEQALYILKNDIKDANKEKLEGFMRDAGYTQEDYERDQALIAGTKELTENPVFNVSVRYRLEGNDLVVEVPFDDMRYYNRYPLTGISVLPMFGAAGMREEGFILIPEGGGALINYNNGKLSQNAYYANVYGWDYCVMRKKAVSETENTFPVFGMTRDGGSFVCMLEGAAPYAGISADIAGRVNSYNTVYASYTVLHSDIYEISAKTGMDVYVFEEEPPHTSILQRYRFVGDDSVGSMAAAYRDRLLERYPEMKNAAASADMPVSVELIGAIDRKVVKLGVPVDTVVETTTFSEAEEIMNDLLSSGVRSLNLRMTGWSNGGLNQKVLTKVKPQKELGGAKAMSALIESAKQKNVPFYFDGISCFAYDSGLFDGFLQLSDSARYTTNDSVLLKDFSIAFYDPDGDSDTYYLVGADYADRMANNLVDDLTGRGAAGVAFRDIGDLLSSDLNPDELVTREQARDKNIEVMKKAAANGLRVSIKKGNDYAAAYADIITDMNLTGNDYAIIDAQTPFYQMVLHGIKDYTGASVNLSGDYMNEVLRCAEYGAGLSFSFMKADPAVVRESKYTDLFAASYDPWREDAIAIITRYQNEMRGLNTTRITDSVSLTSDLTVTVYEDGTKVFVNYGTDDYTADGIVVPARDYTVERSGDK